LRSILEKKIFTGLKLVQKVLFSMETGIDYGKMIKEWAEGKTVESQMGQFKPNLLMLRYDDAIFIVDNKGSLSTGVGEENIN